MRTLLLTALLLAAPAASAQITPAGASSAATTLSLTAPVGASVALTSTVQSRITLEELQVSGPDGRQASEAELAERRADFQRSMGAAAQPTSVKSFYRVQGRAADGTVTLLTSVVTNVPGQGAVTVRLTQTVAQDGRTQITRVESDHPEVQAVLQRLAPGVLRAQTSAGGGDPLSLYGQTFTPGQTRTQTVTVDAQALLGSLFGALSLSSSLGTGNPLGSVKASPLTVRTTTTYRGTNAAGQRVFDASGSAGNWTVELGDLNDRSAPLALRLDLLDLTQSGQSVYRPDGLPAGQSTTQTLRMRMTMTGPGGSRVQMLLRLNQTTQTR